MSGRVTVVDYGLGNLFSVRRALEHVDASVSFSDSAAGIESAERLVLPGVGAFRKGMEGLRARGLVEPLRRFGASGRPLLGICLGMQLLFEWGDEFGREEGLGLMKGGVQAIPPAGADGRPHKIPHIGWNGLLVPEGREGWQGTPLAGVPPRTPMYFVHSFSAHPAEAADRLADCDYDAFRICAAVGHGALYGCQFHPEKSGPAGLRILREFLKVGTC
jgi:glutamine amidotransferase